MSAVLQTALPSTNAWRRSLVWLVLLQVLVLVLYRDTALAMVTIWHRSDTFAHAFLVPPIVLWLVWRKREVVAAYSPSPQPWILLLIAAAGLVWLLADLVAVNAATQFALVALLVLSVSATLGMPIAWQLAFPLVFAFFSVPFGEFVMPQLMQWTADFTVAALQLSGIPVYREGLQFIIPSGTWSVVEACSGVRYLIASFMVGTLFAYLNYRSWQRRLAFCVVSIIVPIVANWLRAYMIVMLGHLSGNKLAVGVDHLIYGWVFFGVVILLMFIIGARWTEPDEPAAGRTPDVGGASKSGANLSTRTWQHWPVAVAAALIVLPHAALWAIDRNSGATTPVLQLPEVLSPSWSASPRPAEEYRPSFDNPTAQAERSYAHKDRIVGVYLAYYRQQDHGKKLVSSENVLAKSDQKDWSIVGRGERKLDIGAKHFAVRTAALRGSSLAGSGDERRLLAWQTYWVGGTLTDSDVKATLLTAWHRLRGRGDDAAAIVVYMPETSSGESAADLESFLQANLDAIEAQLHAASAGR